MRCRIEAEHAEATPEKVQNSRLAKLGAEPAERLRYAVIVCDRGMRMEPH